MNRFTLIFSKFRILVSLLIFCCPAVKNSLFAQYSRYQTITTFAGNGDFTLTSVGPKAIARDGAGSIYISDAYQSLIIKFDPSVGSKSIVAGNTASVGYNSDNILATDAFLCSPVGIALDQSGNIYICDQQNYRVRKVDAVTGNITTIAGNGNSSYTGDGGPATSASLSLPGSIAIDASGNLYIGDDSKVRKISASTGIITTVAGTGVTAFGGDGGPATSADFSTISDIKVDAPAIYSLRITETTGFLELTQ